MNDSAIDNEYSVSGYLDLLTQCRVLMVIMKRLKNVGIEEVKYMSKYRGRREFVFWHK